MQGAAQMSATPNATPRQTPAPAPVHQRAAAIEAALQARGITSTHDIDQRVHMADEVWLPERGARVVARAWQDAAYRQRLLDNGRAAVGELGIDMPPHHRHLVESMAGPVHHRLLLRA